MTRSDGWRMRRGALPGSLTLAVAIGWVLGMGTPAAHADCALGQVCAPSLTSVLPSSPANQVVNDAQQVVDQGTKAANGAVQQVNDTVNKVLNPGGGDGGGGPGGGGGTVSSNGSNQGNGSLPAGSSAGGAATQPKSEPAAHHSSNHGIGGAIGHAAATFGFPLLLAVLVVAFVAIQRRLDRKDPKLALARSEPETVRFL